MIVLRAVLSWIVRDYSNPLMRIAVMLTEPVIQPFRRIIAKSPFGNMGGLDISPAFAYLAIEFVIMFLQGAVI
jgi:YggT family protein